MPERQRLSQRSLIISQIGCRCVCIVFREVVNGVESQIFQTYLQSEAGVEERIRKRGNGNDAIHQQPAKHTRQV